MLCRVSGEEVLLAAAAVDKKTSEEVMEAEGDASPIVHGVMEAVGWEEEGEAVARATEVDLATLAELEAATCRATSSKWGARLCRRVLEEEEPAAPAREKAAKRERRRHAGSMSWVEWVGKRVWVRGQSTVEMMLGVREGRKDTDRRQKEGGLRSEPCLVLHSRTGWKENERNTVRTQVGDPCLEYSHISEQPERTRWRKRQSPGEEGTGTTGRECRYWAGLALAAPAYGSGAFSSTVAKFCRLNENTGSTIEGNSQPRHLNKETGIPRPCQRDLNRRFPHDSP